MFHNDQIYWNTLLFVSILLFFVLGLSTNIVHAEQVVTTIDVGSVPFAVDTNPITNKIYVGNSQSNNVSVIDGNTNTVISTISVGSAPSSIKVNPVTNLIYVTNHESGTVSVIDGKTNSVITTISGMQGPSGVAVNPNSNMIYVADNQDKVVFVINGTTNAIVGKIPFAYNEQPWSVVVNPSTNLIYVPTVCMYCPQSYVVVIDGHTNTRVMNILVGQRPNYVDINTNTNRIYVSDTANNYQIDVIDGLTNSLVTTIPIESTYISGVGVDPNTNLIYATVFDNSTYITNGVDNSIIGKISVGYNPEHVAVNPNTNMIYVTNGGDNTLSVIDGSPSSTSTVVPSPPQNLAATAVSSSQINLSWNAPANDMGHAITGYQIERSTDSGSTWSTIVQNTKNTSTTFSNTGLLPNTTYTYRVSAISDTGISDPSNTSSATTLLISAMGITIGSVKTPVPSQIP